jgi:hypothetical protein
VLISYKNVFREKITCFTDDKYLNFLVIWFKVTVKRFYSSHLYRYNIVKMLILVGLCTVYRVFKKKGFWTKNLYVFLCI